MKPTTSDIELRSWLRRLLYCELGNQRPSEWALNTLEQVIKEAEERGFRRGKLYQAEKDLEYVREKLR